MSPRYKTCAVCGSDAGRWQQHSNRDTGYGICVKCVAWLRGRGMDEAELANLYGTESVNWGVQP